MLYFNHFFFIDSYVQTSAILKNKIKQNKNLSLISLILCSPPVCYSLQSQTPYTFIFSPIMHSLIHHHLEFTQIQKWKSTVDMFFKITQGTS